MDLLLLGELIVRYFNHLFLCESPREYAENRAPSSFNYGTSYPVPLLVFVVVLEYSCISPLILLFGTFYFSYTYLVYKYQFLYGKKKKKITMYDYVRQINDFFLLKSLFQTL
jgi:hypothetical protein